MSGLCGNIDEFPSFAQGHFPISTGLLMRVIDFTYSVL